MFRFDKSSKTIEITRGDRGTIMFKKRIYKSATITKKNKKMLFLHNN